MRILRLSLALAGATMLTLGGGAVRALAADDSGYARVAYLAPDSAPADVYMDGARTLSAVAYRTVSTYMRVAPGPHTIDIRAAGSDPGSKPMTESTATVTSQGYFTLLVGGRSGSLRAGVFQDGFTQPGGGQAEARFVHMAPDVPAVDIALANGQVIFSNVSFLQASTYSPLPAGTYDLQLRAHGTDNVLFTATGVVAGSGTIHSLTAIGGVGQPIQLLQILDATASTSAPVGAAATGGGGAALPDLRRAAGMTAALAGLLVLVLLPPMVRSRHAR